MTRQRERWLRRLLLVAGAAVGTGCSGDEETGTPAVTASQGGQAGKGSSGSSGQSGAAGQGSAGTGGSSGQGGSGGQGGNAGTGGQGGAGASGQGGSGGVSAAGGQGGAGSSPGPGGAAGLAGAGGAGGGAGEGQAGQAGGGGQAGGAQAGDYCAEYYPAGLPTAAGFDAHGWAKVEISFLDAFGISPGDVMPASDFKWLPGGLVPTAINNYISIPFVMTETSGPNAQFQLRWVATQISGATTGAVSVSVSPCAGDFRASATFQDNLSDPYLSGLCRRPFNTAGQLSVDSSDPNNGCYAPPGKRMFINIAAADMFQSAAPTSSSCVGLEPPSQCGVSMRSD